MVRIISSAQKTQGEGACLPRSKLMARGLEVVIAGNEGRGEGGGVGGAMSRRKGNGQPEQSAPFRRFELGVKRV